jgi:hypothetical protein
MLTVRPVLDAVDSGGRVVGAKFFFHRERHQRLD